MAKRGSSAYRAGPFERQEALVPQVGLEHPTVIAAPLVMMVCDEPK